MVNQKSHDRKKRSTRKKRGRGIGQSKPVKPPTHPSIPTNTRKSVNFSPNTKSPSSPKQNKTKKMFISMNKNRQKAVTQYQNRQQEQDLRDMMLGKIPLEGGKKRKTKKRKN
jgi:glycerophosphoryl diester phosphodiesterase